MLPRDWTATLRAVDGATVTGLAAQLTRVPADATDLVIAIGGNDALQNIDLLDTRVESTAAALSLFADRLSSFETSYGDAIEGVVALGVRVVVATIYNGAMPPPQGRLARIGLMLFNDVILRTAFTKRLDVIDLRAICCEAADYANPIEPSGRGGMKIARGIAGALGAPGGSPAACRVWAQ